MRQVTLSLLVLLLLALAGCSTEKEHPPVPLNTYALMSAGIESSVSYDGTIYVSWLDYERIKKERDSVWVRADAWYHLLYGASAQIIDTLRNTVKTFDGACSIKVLNAGAAGYRRGYRDGVVASVNGKVDQVLLADSESGDLIKITGIRDTSEAIYQGYRLRQER